MYPLYILQIVKFSTNFLYAKIGRILPLSKSERHWNWEKKLLGMPQKPFEGRPDSWMAALKQKKKVWKSTNKKFVLHFLSATPPKLESSQYVSLLIQCNSFGKLCKRTVSREQKILDLSNPKCLFVCYVVFFIIKLLFRIPSYHQESASHQGSIM